MRIYYDSYQEGMWFAHAHTELNDADLRSFPSEPASPALAKALLYDRPDILLATEEDEPLLVLERTIEVPSGHNVGQRFARLAAGAEAGVPVVYFGPYSARKHGGETSGPRYMNLRLFQAIDLLMKITGTPVTTIRWPVDKDYEIMHGPVADERLNRYLELFFEVLPQGLAHARLSIRNSSFEYQQEVERARFIEREIAAPEQYERPPPSVEIGPARTIGALRGHPVDTLPHPESVLYKVGMKRIRSDPYTGMGILYAYLYCGGTTRTTRNMLFHFPNVDAQLWHEFTQRSPNSKTTRLFRLVADGILFRDTYLPRHAV